ncbi:dioxygenase [Coniella lustricola]|uniref:Dioxygenase n=1 Tax=Coniella lustricola TaxID=2025994 RepID=A0A2T3A4M7_9PEZI|nr:dioxygenase [Coniella lustricola]
MRFMNLIRASCLAFIAAAHPQHHPRSEIDKLNLLSKRCQGPVAFSNKKRYEQRMRKRAEQKTSENATYTVVTEAPYYDVIQNDTCVLSPEITWGPYVYPNSQTLRQDMSEGQPGVPLTLDVGVMDIETCEPLEGVMVNFWHCNATGSYSSFTALSPNTPFLDLLTSLNISADDYNIGVTDLHTDNTTFLRGMWPTDANGMMEMKTVFPGFYVDRAIHIHVQVYHNWVLRSNGTISSGNIVSAGQLYFDETLEDEIMAISPYKQHTQINRTLNSDDSIFSDGFAGGYDPVISIVPADGLDVTKGMIGYVTIGVNTSAIETHSLGGLDEPVDDQGHDI